jgi:SAM-dependent methyltransferase
MNNEIQHVIERYEKRKGDQVVREKLNNFYFNHYAQAERELRYIEIIKSRFDPIDEISVLEIGAGTGGNIFLFKKVGVPWGNIHANELLPDRFQILKEAFPLINAYQGDAAEMDLNPANLFDIVFQSTVFTSILDSDFKQKLATIMWSFLKPRGIVLWYDFIYDNPQNQDVKGIKKKEIKALFSEAKRITFYKTTLAPPIGRRVKRFYPFFNLLPFLRTHMIAVIEK